MSASAFRPVLLAVLAALLAPSLEAVADSGELRVEIHEPAPGSVIGRVDEPVTVVGGASIFGGVKQLDLFLVIDTSKSLNTTDPRDYRVRGATALVRRLPLRSDIQLGVVDVDGDAELVQGLTKDRDQVVLALKRLDRRGSTDLAEGIQVALAGFESGARSGSSRVILLFTDGRSNEKAALRAMAAARDRGIAIHTLLLGRDDDGEELLQTIASETGGSFVQVTDPAKLPEAFLSLRTTGVDQVTIAVNGGLPYAAQLAGGTFTGSVPLVPGRNEIVATARSLTGQVREARTEVMVSDELAVRIDAPLDGALFRRDVSETEVSGVATLFEGMASDALPADRGVASVVLRVGDAAPVAAALSAGRFVGRVPLERGENLVVAVATSVDGRVAEALATVTVQPPGCAELTVEARRDGAPALSLSDRGVEIVFDASNSMWAQIDGRSKMEIAKETLEQTLDALPDDLGVALRVYGHRHRREERNCSDSELLVSFDDDGRAAVRAAIAGVKPRGQTPLGYSLEQVAADFGDFPGERAVVLVTDGLESCGGDPAAAAAALQRNARMPVHVISFGLGSADDEDVASLRAIAAASGGRFLAAGNADELRAALSETVGTPFEVSRDGAPVARGTLGADDRFRLPEGEYLVTFQSQPERRVPVRLTSEEALALVVEREGDGVSRRDRRTPAEYHVCALAEVAADEPDDPALPASPAR